MNPLSVVPSQRWSPGVRQSVSDCPQLHHKDARAWFGVDKETINGRKWQDHRRNAPFFVELLGDYNFEIDLSLVKGQSDVFDGNVGVCNDPNRTVV
jgi:hypothetical protein